MTQSNFNCRCLGTYHPSFGAYVRFEAYLRLLLPRRLATFDASFVYTWVGDVLFISLKTRDRYIPSQVRAFRVNLTEFKNSNLSSSNNTAKPFLFHPNCWQTKRLRYYSGCAHQSLHPKQSPTTPLHNPFNPSSISRQFFDIT